MKYLSILIIFLCFGLLGACGEQHSESGALVTVNDKTITVNEFRRTLKEDRISADHDETMVYLEQTITRELLIQEALRRGLHREEPFRRTLKNYYEQNLIKSLMAERAGEIRPTVPEDLLLKRYGRLARRLKIRLDTYASKANAEARKGGESAVLVVSSGDLPLEIEDMAYGLKVGAARGPVQVEGGYYATVTLLESESVHAPPLEDVENEITETIREELAEKEMGLWLKSLRKKATVRLHEDSLKNLEVERVQTQN